MFLPILTVMFYSYFSHAARHVTRQMHLASYYFQPSGEESVGSFVLRNLRNTFNVFSPVSLENEIIVLSLSLVLLTAAFACVIGFRSKEGYVLATVPLIFLVTIAGSLIAASILGLYPFGGAARHQFVLYPFIVLSGGVVLDRLLSSTGRSTVKFAILAIGVVGILVNSTVQLWMIRPWRNQPLFSREMKVYRQNIPADVVFLDRFNSIIFFAHHHEWTWSFDGTLEGSVVDQYSLTANGGKLVVFRDRGRFTINFLERRLYYFLRRCLRLTGSRSIVVFHRNWPGGGESRSKKEEEEFKAKVIAAAAVERLTTQKLILDGYNVYAAFALDGGAGENLDAL